MSKRVDFEGSIVTIGGTATLGGFAIIMAGISLRHPEFVGLAMPPITALFAALLATSPRYEIVDFGKSSEVSPT